MISAAMSSGCGARGEESRARAAFSRFAASASDSAVTGKWSFGMSMRGQSNFGKYCVFRGSAVLVSESE